MAVVWGQGSEPLRDSLVVENERIEYLELGMKPGIPVPSFEKGEWAGPVRPSWEKSSPAPLRLPQPLTPACPQQQLLEPLHLRYSMGRYWTQEAHLLWNKTRDLHSDAGARVHHRSNLQGHVPQARWGTTTIAGWGGRYTSRLSIEGRYEGSYQKYRLFAPYAERWAGYDLNATPPDSLLAVYFRQQAEINLSQPARQRYLRYRTGRIDFRTGVPEWLHFWEAGLPIPLSLPGEGKISADAFTDGRRFAFCARPRYRYQSLHFHLEAGLQLALARAGRILFLLAPTGEANYTGLTPLLRPFFRAEASLKPLNHFYQVERNPYLRRAGDPLPFERTWTISHLGIRGQGRGWDYLLAAEYRLQEAVPIFVPVGAAFVIDTLRRLQSTGLIAHLIYLPAPTGAYGELRIAARRWKLHGSYPVFYGEAPVEAALRLGYRPKEQWHFTGALTLLGPRWLDNFTKAPPFVDISWRVERQVLPVLTFFAEMHNLLNRRFYRWRGYQERPLDFSLGVWSKIG